MDANNPNPIDLSDVDVKIQIRESAMSCEFDFKEITEEEGVNIHI